MKRSYLVVLYMLSLSCDPISRQEKGLGQDNTTTISIMFTFSQAISGLETGIARRNAIALARNAAAMGKEARKLSRITLLVNTTMPDQFTNYATEIKDRAVEIQALAKKQQYEIISQSVEKIRHTCISCHIKFRDAERNRYDRFPSRANIVTGAVKIIEPGGLERTDRSNVLIYLDSPFEDTHFPMSVQDVYGNKGSDNEDHFIPLTMPYFAKTDTQGVFVISGVPDGDYVLKTWYESGQPLHHEIQVADYSLNHYDLLIKENQPSTPSKNHPDPTELIPDEFDDQN